ncbi:hypothetical protein QPK31_10845 [Massilia sp. YIM B02769]|uniref:hypothetical protein n=1 Tax=Massilia sp. YIM B02769 TaxID=3050129 RepID=UPI0025B7109E|nr:hypothetical protein [Massilia sp. YIM B02769]MDN4058718.1 hypothetical protein [Massilia sp. YIM B02769]
MRQHLYLGILALLGACSKEAPPAAPAGNATSATAPAATEATQEAPRAATPAPATLSAAGIGSIRFGMTLEQAQQAAGGKATLPEPFDPACSMVRFATLPKLRFMVENDVVTRADAEPGVENAVGIPFGATLADIRASHPEAQITPHKYDENGHYITFPSADGRSAIILEETGGKVTKMRAGLQPAVAYVETCG